MGGQFTLYDGQTHNRIIRINAAGNPSSGFNSGTGFNNSVFHMDEDSLGRILCVGNFVSYNGNSRTRIARILANGDIDASFEVGTGPENIARAVLSLPDNKVLVGGQFTSYQATFRGRLGKVTSTGEIIESFHTGVGFNNQVRAVTVDNAESRVLMGGSFTTFEGGTATRIKALSLDGTEDNTFDSGTGFNNVVYDIIKTQDDKYLVGGQFTNYAGNAGRNRICKLNLDGSIDNTTSLGTGFNNIVVVMSELTNGDVLYGGSFTTFQGVSSVRLAKSDSTGARHGSFEVGTGFNNTVWAIEPQPDGKILVGGQFTNFAGTATNRIVRLNADGSRDNDFVIGTGFNSIVYDIEVLSNGKILVGGAFTNYAGTGNINRLALLNEDGSLDVTWSQNTNFSSTVLEFKKLSDGKILVVGAFGAVDGEVNRRLARLNADGSIDETFDTATGFNNTVWALDIDSDGNIYTGGEFTAYQEPLRNRLIRLNEDGSYDSSFITGNGFDNSVWALALQQDGKYLVGGQFNNYNGETAPSLIRLNSDGTVDNTFNIGAGFNNIVRVL